MKMALSTSVTAVLTLGLTLSASSALAYPAIHDKVVYSVVQKTPAGELLKGTSTLEVIAYDEATQTYTMRNTLYVQGKKAFVDIQKGNPPTQATVLDILATCVEKGGTPEVVMVSGKEMNACKALISDGSTSWIVDVPFSIVKMILVDKEQNTTESTLQSYVNGR
jgi:hypothetical protein